jgi:hypothetical protein
MNTVAQLRAYPSIVDLSHEERIELVADGASGSFQPKAIDDSWRRCLRDFMSTHGAAQYPTCSPSVSSGSLANAWIAFYSKPRKR